MQDVLIALQTDLASNIALHYAGHLEKAVPCKMQAIHIPHLETPNHSPGGGWVHQAWEEAVLQKSRQQISQLIRGEAFQGARVGRPKIVPGERDLVILDEIVKNKYDLLIEGLLHAFEPDRFFKKLGSELYRNLPCPVLMVKNLMDLKRGVQIVASPARLSSVMAWFFKLFSDLPVAPDILVCIFENTPDEIVVLENDPQIIADAENQCSKHGKTPGSITTVKGSASKMAARVRDHALVVSPLPNGNSAMAQLLSRSPCPTLFCPSTNRGKRLR
jgi:hypothetical protein